MHRPVEPGPFLRIWDFDGLDAMFGLMEDADDQFIFSITPDVMKSLVRSGFFEKLDDLLCPNDDPHPRRMCGGNYEISAAVLLTSGFEQADLADILDVLGSKGGCCDCEILFNVVESSRLKSEYWRRRAQGLKNPTRHSEE